MPQQSVQQQETLQQQQTQLQHQRHCIWTSCSQLITFMVLLLLIGQLPPHAEALKVTAKIISNHNYPVEEHIVHTPDDYILTIYRIPDSPRLRNQNNTNGGKKPVVFLQHGILCASDDWIINGPQTSLAYMFADAGYDVWLGNARGNTYSRQHKSISADSSDFWKFSWHEIGVYDLASMLDYVLDETQEESVHFVAHSQGTTTYFVLMSTLPWYNSKMRTVHLLAPIAFMRHHSFILSKLGGIFLGHPSFLSWILAGMELLPITSVQKLMCEYVCSTDSMFRFLCSGLLDFIGGWGTKHLNHFERITAQNYTAEEHDVPTVDGHNLKIFRIIDTPNTSTVINGNISELKPAVLLQHGMFCSSDTWLLTEPDKSLAYQLANLGFDVWLGNARGNIYAQPHKEHSQQFGSAFWNYSTHEVGIYDIAAMLDYIALHGDRDNVHYIGYSEGTMALMVLLSTLPHYNQRISSAHLLAPMAFMSNGKFPFFRLSTYVWHYIEQVTNTYIPYFGTLSRSKLIALLGEHLCTDDSHLQWVCESVFNIIGGWKSSNLNTTLLPHVCETHPAGASTTQIIHYLQLYNSGDFRQFDHGIELNQKYYQQETPPSYNISNISSCVHLYYSDNDYMSAVADVEYLATLLPCVDLYRIPHEDWNHYDFLWSINVKEEINDRIIDKMIRHESELLGN